MPEAADTVTWPNIPVCGMITMSDSAPRVTAGNAVAWASAVRLVLAVTATAGRAT